MVDVPRMFVTLKTLKISASASIRTRPGRNARDTRIERVEAVVEPRAVGHQREQFAVDAAAGVHVLDEAVQLGRPM